MKPFFIKFNIQSMYFSDLCNMKEDSGCSCLLIIRFLRFFNYKSMYFGGIIHHPLDADDSSFAAKVFDGNI